MKTMPLAKPSASFEPRFRPLVVTVSFVAPSSASRSQRCRIGPSASDSGSQRAWKVVSSRFGGSIDRISPSAATVPSGRSYVIGEPGRQSARTRVP